MPIEPAVFFAFVLASVLLLVIPGPTVIMLIGQSLAHGRSVALASVIGVGLGDLCVATLSLAGVGALLATSATAFTVLKWIGAAYLVWLGVKLWRAPANAAEPQASGDTGRSPKRRVFREAFLVTLFNPKGIVFFVAFVPQFINWSVPYAPQAVLFVLTFTVLGVLNGFLFAFAASSARSLATRPSVLGTLQKTGGVCLAGAGLLSLAARRPISG